MKKLIQSYKQVIVGETYIYSERDNDYNHRDGIAHIVIKSISIEDNTEVEIIVDVGRATGYWAQYENQTYVKWSFHYAHDNDDDIVVNYKLTGVDMYDKLERILLHE